MMKSILFSLLLCSQFAFAGNPYRISFENEPETETQEETPKKTHIGAKPKTRNYYKMLELKYAAEKGGEAFSNEQASYGDYPHNDVTILVGAGTHNELDQKIRGGWTYVDIGAQMYLPAIDSTIDGRRISGVLGIEGNVSAATNYMGGEMHLYGAGFKDFPISDTYKNTWGIAFASADLKIRYDVDGRTFIRPMITGLFFRPKGASTIGVLIGPHFASNQSAGNDDQQADVDPSTQLTSEFVDLSNLPKDYQQEDLRSKFAPGYSALAIADLRFHKNVRIEFEAGVGEVFYQKGSELLERIHLNSEAKIIWMSRGPLGLFLKGQFNQYWLKNAERFDDQIKFNADVNQDGTFSNGAVYLGIEIGVHVGDLAKEREF